MPETQDWTASVAHLRYQVNCLRTDVSIKAPAGVHISVFIQRLLEVLDLMTDAIERLEKRDA